MSSSLLVKGRFKSRVSSVLNKNSKEYGKDNMFDGSDESCWNSHQGSPQSCSVQFLAEDGQTEQPVNVSSLQICFQGGFVGKDCEIHAITSGSDSFALVSMFYPEDINTVQAFPVDIKNALQVKVLFKSSTDFFGRITIYKLDLLGDRS
ncbi:galactose-binding domain-containing protein [Heterostelium album PN500]|uniref:Galactose-binding domain-containing protein n=1 Tax=Heterostelium pallidum (strain ATCC 26659 / Pp 5 / PN500) TaxID=670386 RepID=D3B5W0_HETP5|nr:galactose-binding domain-containing protein [Heterostelium album PN500]EFA83258.1 galactose-binding domain-containing protein [Heterostelium album PN500]|eukprot:XP_020435375.1 galactose-binding domain-containing protein [Heterostelium album PN500]